MKKTGRFGRIGWLVVALTLVYCARCVAQQVASVDLTQVGAHSGFRRPVPKDGENEHRQGGDREIRGCPRTTKTTDGPSLRSTLVSLDRSEYQVGDTEKFQLRLENVGPVPVTIPFSAHPADVQPADASQKFKYSELKVDVWIGGTAWDANTAGTVRLYGAPAYPETMLTLQPGEWALILGEGKIMIPEIGMTYIRKGDVVNHANAKGSLFASETLLTAAASATVSRGVCLDESQGPDVAVRVNVLE